MTAVLSDNTEPDLHAVLSRHVQRSVSRRFQTERIGNKVAFRISAVSSPANASMMGVSPRGKMRSLMTASPSLTNTSTVDRSTMICSVTLPSISRAGAL
jgi:hypothetical protein